MGDEFGAAVAVNSDGSYLAVGAPAQDSPTSDISITGNSSNSKLDSGAAYLFRLGNGNWITDTTRALKAKAINAGDRFGASVALSYDASYVLVGAPNEDSGASGVGTDDTSQPVVDSGAAFIFKKNDLSAPTRIKASKPNVSDLFGSTVAMNFTGRVVVIGAPGDRSLLQTPTDTSGSDVGSVYAYTFRFLPSLTVAVNDIAYLKSVAPANGAKFGSSVSVSSVGDMIAVGVPGDARDVAGVNAPIANAGVAVNAGAAEVLVEPAKKSEWTSATSPVQYYIKANVVGAGDAFGTSVALSADGMTMVAGAPGEDGNGQNISVGNNPNDNSALESGAAYIF
jgi:hypothetical protein